MQSFKPFEAWRALRPTGDTRPNDAQVWAGRALWAVFAIPMIVLFFMGVPNAQRMLLVVYPETARALARIGLTVPQFASYAVTIDIFIFVLMTAIAILLMLRRSNDRIVVLVALMLVSTGLIYTVPAYEARAPAWVLGTLIAIGEVCQVMFFFMFPDGRFLPRRSWLIAVVMLVWRPLVWVTVYIPNYYAAVRTGENYGGLRQDLLQTLLMVALFVIGIASQVYRYRRMSGNAQRQQTKWLLFGVVIAFGVALPNLFLQNVFGLISRPGEAALFARVLGRTLRQIGLCLIPLTLLFSMLRYRLWEVDRLINRALVYSVLTAALLALYVGSIFLLQQFFRSITRAPGGVTAIVISTIGIALLFEPLRQLVQRAVDKRFFRAKYDAERTIAALTNSLQNEVDLGRVQQHLVGAVETTLQPEHMSVWVRPHPIVTHPSTADAEAVRRP